MTAYKLALEVLVTWFLLTNFGHLTLLDSLASENKEILANFPLSNTRMHTMTFVAT